MGASLGPGDVVSAGSRTTPSSARVASTQPRRLTVDHRGMRRMESGGGVEECDARVWLPGRLLAELTALEDGFEEVANPYECLLPAGHLGEHWCLGMEVPGDMGYWVVWSDVPPPRLVVAGFCLATLPTFDPEEEVSCQLADGHEVRHLGYGPAGPDRPRSETVIVCW